jgi:hypothetical protein
MHGGAAPQVKAAAQRRKAEQEALATAQRMVARAGIDADPIEHLLDSLHLAKQLVYVWGTMVAAIDDAAEQDAQRRNEIRGELSYRENVDPDSRDELIVVANDRMMALNRHGEAQVHPYVQEYQKALERWAKLAKMCIDAGIAERQIRMVEQQVEMAHKVFEATLEDMQLAPAKRQEARRAYARHLRLVA